MMTKSPFLVCMSSPPLQATHAPAVSPSNCDDEVPIPRLAPRPALVSFDSDDEILIPCPLLSSLPSTFRSSVRPPPVPRRLMPGVPALVLNHKLRNLVV